MSTGGRQQHVAGFTLLEMLVVIAILALTTTLAVPLLSGGSDRLRLQLPASELARAFRATRSAAITGRGETNLTIDVERRTFRSTVVRQRALPPDTEVKLTFASALRSGPSDGAFRFFPDGSSTGGEVTLSLRGRGEKLCVDWLTGAVQREPKC